jgi:2,4-dienoyl-CoA reductase-like NADH-dependent reductase (Old Yellow Enzyme family)
MLTEIPHPLLQPHRLGDLLLPNRVVLAPLTRGRAHNPWHVPNDLMREYYEQRPEGYYGAAAFGNTDYPVFNAKDLHAGIEGASLSLMSAVV